MRSEDIERYCPMKDVRLNEIKKYYREFLESEDNRKLVDDVEHRERFIHLFNRFCIAKVLGRFSIEFDQILEKFKYEAGDRDAPIFKAAYTRCVGTGLEETLRYVVPVKDHTDEFVFGFLLNNADLCKVPVLLSDLRNEYVKTMILDISPGYLTGDNRYHLWVFVREVQADVDPTE